VKKEHLQELAAELISSSDEEKKYERLLSFVKKEHLLSPEAKKVVASVDDGKKRLVFLMVVALQQTHLLFHPTGAPIEGKALRKLLQKLAEIDHFYSHLGGLIGYHLKVLDLLGEKQEVVAPLHIEPPAAIDLSRDSEQVRAFALLGLKNLGQVAELYPMGGLGARLHLQDANKEPLAAAYLPFLGRDLLEILVRDLEAREYLHYKLFGKQANVLILIMTSEQHQNEQQIEALLQKHHHFHRTQERIFLFSQPLAPVLTHEGHWAAKRPGEPLLHPGGHGAIWKVAAQKGAFLWLREHDVGKLFVRQINNPLASLDRALLPFFGVGIADNKRFGFMACEREAGTSEGTLVCQRVENHVCISNIEYSDVKRLHIEEDGAYLANLNILFADLDHIEDALKKEPLPGLMINMKMQVPHYHASGECEEKLGGRLESMMQNISESVHMQSQVQQDCFVAYERRSKIMAAIKKADGDKKIETPESAYYALLQNNHALLKEACLAKVAPFCSWEDFLQKGPSHIFYYHPALGPTYEIISQKLKGLTIDSGSELELELTEFFCQDLHLSGALNIVARQPLGHLENGKQIYSDQSGKCTLKNVRVQNDGVDFSADNIYWKNQIAHKQRMQITLEGSGEFHAEDVVFRGEWQIVVADGMRTVARMDANGEVVLKQEPLEHPSWHWKYAIGKKSHIQLKRVQHNVFLTR